MKTLFRVLLILVVTSIIGGLMYVGVSASDSTATVGTLGEGEGRPQLPEGAEFRPDHDEDREGEGGFGFPGGIVKALVLMSVAGGVYSAIVWTSKKSKSVTSR